MDLSFSGPEQLAGWFLREGFRPGLQPWAVLVTTWRHAKPCAEGIRRARASGKPSSCEAQQSREAPSALACMLVLVEGSMEESRARKWAREACKPGGACGQAVPIAVHSLLQREPMILFVPRPPEPCRD
mmetsp:Transcript_98497/g.274038  ORF Transcript_98497/g.274038 Transcript_98497/m.274038 type:complete len:129 (-) Transcript_98497:341-727(-)